MAFYDLNKEERAGLVERIRKDILSDLQTNKSKNLLAYFSDEDTYIRKGAYLSVGRLYFTEPDLQIQILAVLDKLLQNENFKVRQTVINAAGEIGKADFKVVRSFFDKGLFDKHHSPRNAVIGSIKKMGEVNPLPVLKWTAGYLQHPDKEIRREICHGIELRGRKFPQDILPLLKQLEFDKTARVSKTLVHVLGQIAYKKGCLETVIADLKTWRNKELVAEALEEIVDVHHRYRNFSALSQAEARKYIKRHFPT
jgi:HEAT repeat protein